MFVKIEDSKLTKEGAFAVSTDFRPETHQPKIVKTLQDALDLAKTWFMQAHATDVDPGTIGGGGGIQPGG